MKILKQLSILFLFPLLCSMIAQPEATSNTPKSGVTEKKWVQKLEKRIQLILERKGLSPTKPADNEEKKGKISLIMGISSVILFVLSFAAVQEDGTGRKDDRVVALGGVGLLVALLLGIATFIIGRKNKTKAAKIGKNIAKLSLFLLFLVLLVLAIIVIQAFF